MHDNVGSASPPTPHPRAGSKTATHGWVATLEEEEELEEAGGRPRALLPGWGTPDKHNPEHTRWEETWEEGVFREGAGEEPETADDDDEEDEYDEYGKSTRSPTLASTSQSRVVGEIRHFRESARRGV